MPEPSLSQKITQRYRLEKILFIILVVAIVAVFAFIFYLIFTKGMKKITLISPIGGEEWVIGNTYEIKWKARGIDKVGIVLFHEKEAEWIAKNYDAKKGVYRWKIYPGQKCGGGYWIAVFEYPWQKRSKIAYSKGPFSISYSQFVSCDALSVQYEWPFLPSDLPNLRRVFITQQSYRGNLGGLEGADKICQKEAEAQGFGGKWHAFIGGDGDEETAIKRLERTPRGTEGIFVEARQSSQLIRGATCHRLLGRNFTEFLDKLLASTEVNKGKFSDEFFQNLSNLWLGRVGDKSKKNCIPIYADLKNPYKPLAEKYSFTSTCQNWTKDTNFVENYPYEKGKLKPQFPTCYTETGTFTEAVALAGLSSGIVNDRFVLSQGKSCDLPQKLLCIEE